MTLVALALADVLFNRSIGAYRNLVFVLVTGASCVVMTGLPQVVFADFPARLEIILKAWMMPLSGAIALNYLGGWLGGMREDVIVYRITTWGSNFLFLSAIVLALFATQISIQNARSLLMVTAVVNVLAVLLALGASIRAATRGDPLAWWMALACTNLAIMMGGLNLRFLNVEGVGLGTWIVTAMCSVAYFLMATLLIITRNRQTRRLKRLARLQSGADPATGLPTGSILLSKVEHAFWRTARFHGQCTVVCLHLRNLYELGEAAGHGVEHQILAAMAARIRRAAGFRCVVGLYQPRCFVVVLALDKRHVDVHQTVTELRAVITRPLLVVGIDASQHNFMPSLGVGVVTVDPGSSDPSDVINTAERQALAPEVSPQLESAPQSLSADAVDTQW
jgi:GGDEF domain-containing protein